MHIKDIPSPPSSKSGVQNREWYSVWSRFHPLIVIPYWSVISVLMIIILKSLVCLKDTQNGAVLVWTYVMIIAVLFTLLLVITRAFEYLLDVFLIFYDNNNRNSTGTQSRGSSFLVFVKSFSQSLNQWCFSKRNNDYGQNQDHFLENVV
ncbi:unnamed protein product [Rotaria magnacalcarata]|uniref:Uncharacterized protein n=1 Tax=Rotaria magnacalcarata TaxID=392030 RepID=A0A815RNU9_9BILA|nr:unnamed protein product [Rotaria magnacalcarata]